MCQCVDYRGGSNMTHRSHRCEKKKVDRKDILRHTYQSYKYACTDGMQVTEFDHVYPFVS